MRRHNLCPCAPVQDLDLLKKMFQVKAPAKKSKDATKAPVKQRPLLLKQERKQKLGIVLRFLKMPVTELKLAIVAMDTTKLDSDNLEALNTILPTTEEMDAVKREANKPEADRVVLDDLETYVLEVQVA